MNVFTFQSGFQSQSKFPQKYQEAVQLNARLKLLCSNGNMRLHAVKPAHANTTLNLFWKADIKDIAPQSTNGAAQGNSPVASMLNEQCKDAMQCKSCIIFILIGADSFSTYPTVKLIYVGCDINSPWTVHLQCSVHYCRSLRGYITIQW